jgi:hypothetical protein
MIKILPMLNINHKTGISFAGKVYEMKKFYIQERIGRAKYLVNFHDGVKTHPDGSEFYDIRIFKNKKLLNIFIRELCQDGYTG